MRWRSARADTARLVAAQLKKRGFTMRADDVASNSNGRYLPTAKPDLEPLRHLQDRARRQRLSQRDEEGHGQVRDGFLIHHPRIRARPFVPQSNLNLLVYFQGTQFAFAFRVASGVVKDKRKKRKRSGRLARTSSGGVSFQMWH